MQPSSCRLCKKGGTAPLCSYGSQANVLPLISVRPGMGHLYGALCLQLPKGCPARRAAPVCCKAARVWQQVTGGKLIGSPQGSSFPTCLCPCAEGSWYLVLAAGCWRGITESMGITSPGPAVPPCQPRAVFPLSLGRLTGSVSHPAHAEHPPGHWELWLSRRGCSVPQPGEQHNLGSREEDEAGCF